MDETKQDAAFLSALTTEHFVLQTSISATLNEAQSRATMFIGILTGALIAMGFATRSMDVLIPFIATVLPAVFFMGVITVLRLTDISMENSLALVGIARIRRQYRSLAPEGESFFAARFGRWPENHRSPALRLGSFAAYWTSAASMIAAIDALVGAAAATLLLRLVAGAGLLPSLLVGAGFAAGLLIAFYNYQKLRISEIGSLTNKA